MRTVHSVRQCGGASARAAVAVSQTPTTRRMGRPRHTRKRIPQSRRSHTGTSRSSGNTTRVSLLRRRYTLHQGVRRAQERARIAQHTRLHALPWSRTGAMADAPDGVVKAQAVDIIGLIFSLIRRKTASQHRVDQGTRAVSCSPYLRGIGVPVHAMESAKKESFRDTPSVALLHDHG